MMVCFYEKTGVMWYRGKLGEIPDRPRPPQPRSDPGLLRRKEKEVERIAPEHLDVIRTLAATNGWKKQKVKSIRGQVLSMQTFAEREEYLRKIIKRSK